MRGLVGQGTDPPVRRRLSARVYFRPVQFQARCPPPRRRGSTARYRGSRALADLASARLAVAKGELVGRGRCAPARPASRVWKPFRPSMLIPASFVRLFTFSGHPTPDARERIP